MSYTFLPYSEQHNIRREYRTRVLIVLFFFVSISFVVGVGSLFPAYIFAVLEERNHLDQVAAFQKTVDTSTVEAIQKQLSQSATTLNTVSGALETTSFYSTVTSIVSLKGNVTLTSISVEQSKTSTTVNISGIAPTRADLLAFKNRLQGPLHTAIVDLPISILAQDIHVSFTLQVIEPLK